MKKNLYLLLAAWLLSFPLYAQVADSTQMQIDLIEQSLSYKTGTIELESGNATLNVPKGYRFLDRMQSIYVLTDLWGNPADSTVLGMIVPEGRGVLAADGYAFVISFEEMGFVKDEDADDIDYDDLLKDMQKETEEGNPERIKNGYDGMHFIGWASAPYYDKEHKTLHWAKEIKFGDATTNTLNYNLNFLGRKGVLMLNAVATMNELNDVKSSIPQIVNSIEFKEGHRYSDFIPDTDNVAAWTIGGLVAGKVLAKVGFFALLLKFWKLIFIAIAGAGAAIWKFITGKKKEEEEETVEEAEELPAAEETAENSTKTEE